MATKSKAGGGSAKERVAAMRAAEQRKERLRWLLTFSVVLLIVGALGGGAFWAVNKDKKDQEKKAAMSNAERIAAGPPNGGTWALPSDPTQQAERLGLAVKNNMEGDAKHVHAHLDVFVNGKAVPIPANLGINTLTGDISELHTHDGRGVLHVESFSKDKVFDLNQVFQQWEVPFDRTQLGSLKTDATHKIKIYVDGKEVQDDPSKISLEAHRQIAVLYGTDADNAKVKIETTYPFEKNE
ncbi:hypothetical protein GCM10027589_43970 [Actinocorallia lasiicapitis]